MDFKSLFRFFGKGRKRQPFVRKPAARAPRRLWLEQLEERELLATAPSIIAVTPPDGLITANTHPTLSITFNEDVIGADNSANYVLFDATNFTVPINSATYSNNGGAGPFVVTLGYNNNNPLGADTYTLFVHGDRIFDAATDTLPLAGPGQLVVANAATNNIGVLNMPANGPLSAVSNYPVSDQGFQGTPRIVAMGDFSLDGRDDVLVYDSSNQILAFFAAQPGGTFHSSPDLVLNPGSGASVAGIAVGDFNNDGAPDFATVSGSNSGTVSVYMNRSIGLGDLRFAAAATYTGVGQNPTAIIAGEFNGDGRLDLVTVTGVAAQDIDGDGVNDYFLTFLPGGNNGVFGAQTRLKIGDTANNQAFPRALAAGQFNNDNRQDLVVGGSNGITVVNHNNANGFVFTATFVASTGINTLATGVVRNSFAFSDDIVATSNAGRLVVFMNDGAGTFRPFNGIATASFANAVQMSDLDFDGTDEILTADDAGQVEVFRNLSRSGFISNASNTTPITITSFGHGLRNGEQVLITGVQGNTNANGVFTVANVTATTFDLAGSAGNAAYTGGGQWFNLALNSGTGAVTAASNTTPIVITSNAHRLTTGQLVTITGVNGNTAANGTFTITVIDANNFSLNGSAGNGIYTSGGTWSVAPIIVDRRAQGLALGDVDGDFNTDFVTISPTQGGFSVGRGNGDRTFQISRDLPVGPNTTPDAVVSRDLNGDGLPTVVTANFTANTVTVFLALAEGGYAQPKI